MEIFSARLKFLRERNALYTYQIADKLRLSTLSYEDLENGQRKPDVDMLSKLPDILGESVDFLIGVTDYDKLCAHFKLQYMRSVVGYVVSEQRIKELEEIFSESRDKLTQYQIDAHTNITKEYISDMLKIKAEQREFRDRLYTRLEKIPFISKKTLRNIDNEVAETINRISSNLSEYYPPLTSIDWRLSYLKSSYPPKLD
ncbi:helix-turn-helix transcriptional regulator [Paenibacillus sp. RRE4]|uniref:helix-turn-helix domain-containing protein n=1 Tax=Paenibacillus sp. RRE4 TaxID=2962587 RepID=UPI0028815DA2|nr:helix-turn-helix transcriptional regulator [Paenibacillus sp. RRE4]MDT0124193.1 helix-turn-helix transcriptional regulator [Paenibacillus sp. RRE4]